jgi:cytochrome c oxidase subunit IV
MSEGTRGSPWTRPILVWLWLVLLATGSIGSAYVPLGPFNTALNLGIAGVMVALLWLFLMELVWTETLVRLIAVSTLVWLAFMFALTLTDYFSRA